MSDAPDDAPRGSRSGYFVGGLALCLASFIVASLGGALLAPALGPVGIEIFYATVLLAPLAQGVYLGVRRLLRGKRCPWIAFTVGAVAPWLLLVTIFLGPLLVESARRREFDSGEWKAVAESRSRDRIRMVDDLIDSGTLDGLAEARVDELLGKDDRDSGYFRNWDRIYWLGPERGFISIDSEWLVVRFGEDGRVAAYRIVRD